MPRPIGVAGTIGGQEGLGGFYGEHHFRLGFTDTHAAYGVAVESDLEEAFGAFRAEFGTARPLDDAEEKRALALGLRGPPFLAAARPAQREIEAAVGVLEGTRVRRALVEDHDDVGTEVALDFHRRFGTNERRRAVEVVLKADALLGNLSKFCEREDLESTAIREDRAIPSHELVQATLAGDELFARGGREDGTCCRE